MYILFTELKILKKKQQDLTELERDTENSVIIVEYFNTHLSVIDKITKQ